MKIFRKNQIVITALAGLIAVAGYLNHVENTEEKGKLAGTTVKNQETGEETISAEHTNSTSNVMETKVQENVQQNNTKDKEQDSSTKQVAVQGEEIKSNDIDIEGEPGEAVLVNAAGTVDFIVEAKLSREEIRASSRESLMDIVNNTNLTEEEKVAAVNKVVELTEEAEKESAAENMIGAKGYKNVVVTIQEHGVDVMIATDKLDDTARAQIEEIVKTQTGVSVDKITITAVKDIEK